MPPPNDWLQALVTPIHKKSLQSDPANYRPISLTCILCKVTQWRIQGGFGLPGNPPSPGHDLFFKSGGVTPLLAPTFTSHLNLRLLEPLPLRPTLDTPLLWNTLLQATYGNIYINMTLSFTFNMAFSQDCLASLN